MSWQSYIDSLLADKGNGKSPVQDAAICGKTSGQESMWAHSPGLTGITVDEIQKLVNDTAANLQTKGVYIAGTKCMFVRDCRDDPAVLCLILKTSQDAEGNTFSVCVGTTHQTLIIVKGKKDAGVGEVAKWVYDTVKHLRDSNY